MAKDMGHLLSSAEKSDCVGIKAHVAPGCARKRCGFTRFFPGCNRNRRKLLQLPESRDPPAAQPVRLYIFRAAVVLYIVTSGSPPLSA